MYKINPPKIHLSTVLGYDVEGKRYIVKDEKIFDTERELVCFLARYNRPVCNFEGEPIAGRYNNKYMDNQALNGLMRKDLYDSTYDEIMYTMYHYPISRLHYKSINGEREVPGQQKVVRGSNIPVLTSHVGQNPRSCTALSLIDGRETRPRLVHASIARGITASLVSLCEAWLRAGTASYQKKKTMGVIIRCAIFPSKIQNLINISAYCIRKKQLKKILKKG